MFLGLAASSLHLERKATALCESLCHSLVRISEDSHSTLTHRRPWPGDFLPHPDARAHAQTHAYAQTRTRSDECAPSDMRTRSDMRAPSDTLRHVIAQTRAHAQTRSDTLIHVLAQTRAMLRRAHSDTLTYSDMLRHVLAQTCARSDTHMCCWPCVPVSGLQGVLPGLSQVSVRAK